MFNILTGNPEAFREWQYNQYQRSLEYEDEYEPLTCCICGDLIELGGEVHLHSTQYCCPDCVAAEMEENELSRDEAIESLIKQTSRL